LQEWDKNTNAVPQRRDITVDIVLIFILRIRARHIKKATLKEQENFLIKL